MPGHQQSMRASRGARLIATILIATPTGGPAAQRLRASAVLISEFINEDAAGGGDIWRGTPEHGSVEHTAAAPRHRHPSVACGSVPACVALRPNGACWR